MIKQVCTIILKPKFTVTLSASLVKFRFRNETPRARAKPVVSYGGKQSSVKRISSMVHKERSPLTFQDNQPNM